jgi:hypothetical protein
MVDFNPSKFEAPASRTGYKIIRLLPLESGEMLYRIKSITEINERVAKERDLSLRTAP